jgi:hypothetical protein
MAKVFVALLLALVPPLLWAVAMLIPGLNVIGLIVVMLPLWALHDLGVAGLGMPNNGFFVPTMKGYTLGAAILYAVSFFLCLLIVHLGSQGSRKA